MYEFKPPKVLKASNRGSQTVLFEPKSNVPRFFLELFISKFLPAAGRKETLAEYTNIAGRRRRSIKITWIL